MSLWQKVSYVESNVSSCFVSAIRFCIWWFNSRFSIYCGAKWRDIAHITAISKVKTSARFRTHCTIVLGVFCTSSDNLGGTGLHKHKGHNPWSVEENHDIILASTVLITVSPHQIQIWIGSSCAIMCFLTFLRLTEWQKIQSGLDIYLSLNDNFVAEWVASVLWPAEVVG